MAGRFSIWTDFRVGRRDTSKEIRSMRSQLVVLESSASSAMATMQGFVGAQIIGRGLSMLSMGLREVTTQFIDFDQAVTGAGARWGDAFDRGTQGFEAISEAARATGAATEHTSAEAGSALQFMAMAGFDAAESIGLLPDMADLATAANVDFARSADIASDALGAFGLAEGTATEKVQGFKKIVDQATKSTNMSNQTLEMWFEAIREGAPAFTSAEQKMSTLNATLGVLADSGKKGATAGYMVRNMILRLSAPVGKAKRLIEQLGLNVADKDGNFRDFIDILTDLEKGLEGMGSVKRAEILDTIFGKRAISGVNLLLQEGSESIREFANAIEQSEGAAGDIAEKMRGSIGNRIKKLQAAATELGFKLFDAFGPDIEKAIEGIGRWLDDNNANATELINTVREVGSTFLSVGRFIVENRELIMSLTKAWLVMKGGMIIGGTITGGFNTLNSLLGATVTGTGLATTSISTMTKSLNGLGVAIGGVTAAFTAGLAIGNLFWESMERNSKRAQTVANRSLKMERKVTSEKLKSYSDANLNRLLSIEREAANVEHATFFGWDPNREEHETARKASQQTYEKLLAEKKRRERIARAGNLLGSSPVRYGNASYTAGNPTMSAVSRTESVTREEIRHTLRLEDKEKRATLTPADAGVMQ